MGPDETTESASSRAAERGREEGTVVGILGPTGVGKTAVALELAGLLGVRIISCDSMQVYRGFPVLTNHPSAEEQQRVPHELVGIVEAGEEFSAAEYSDLAGPLIDEDLDLHGAALVVGGTGLYMRAALAPLAVRPAADEDLRRQLEERHAAEGPEALHEELARHDPTAAAGIDPRNTRRVLRALESVLRTGSAWSGRDDLWHPIYRHPTLLIALTLDREELYRRIDTRAREIVWGGALEEVARFRSAVLGATVSPVDAVNGSSGGKGRGITAAIGFTEISRYLDGLQTLDSAAEQVAAATRRYARRQLTWLRKLDGLVIIDVHGKRPTEVAGEVLAMLSSGEHIKEPQHS